MDCKPLHYLAVEGIFLEIGLEPNTQAVADLISLNDHGEVPTHRGQSTALSGLFAAGDVTDDPDKQIVIAAGTGAKVALSADHFLAGLNSKYGSSAVQEKHRLVNQRICN